MTVAQQALSVFATLVLRYWGEHNRKVGGNSGMLEVLAPVWRFFLWFESYWGHCRR
jgi:ATP-binding cassette subfamily C (CFTR/MRP) protein 1